MSENKPFIIYLDIDGVLVSYSHLLDRDEDGKHSFVKNSVETLNAIITMFNADICCISTWGRHYVDNVEELKTFLIKRGITINNLTVGDCDDRVGYILNMKAIGYDKFLIIDDEVLEYYKRVDEIGYNRILASNSWRCLDEYDLIGITRNYKRLLSNYPENF